MPRRSRRNHSPAFKANRHAQRSVRLRGALRGNAMAIDVVVMATERFEET